MYLQGKVYVGFYVSPLALTYCTQNYDDFYVSRLALSYEVCACLVVVALCWWKLAHGDQVHDGLYVSH